ncbi:hypothetical protein CRD70_14020 [Listeria monocytogenes]|uniref:Uncharacterized protein n=1 Tax=Listeria monocytogenes TaxID=1639 RepID=A0A823J8E3_LISMN|nr:hypothetical protein [Listeria monocytogenes]EAD7214000.1 hypothetical protein [Listeria monocytogenes]EAE5923273.1 hypothetical protein [Listeria monocytogenes]EAG6688900.1 hypothetical protein [Listeria monocytogenes]EAG9355036.1 hypothetical protein [Listeria monocytogenes]EHY61365.1 hypothetical protein LMIV_p030 [Listeria monocytogenes FSL J1-208]
MKRTEIMKEYQQKLEGIFKNNYTVATPLLQEYDQQHQPFDSIDVRLQAINQMDRNGSSIPKETLEYLSNQLSSISANYTVEEQKSFLRNEGRQIKMNHNHNAITLKVPVKRQEKKQSLEQERSY